MPAAIDSGLYSLPPLVLSNYNSFGDAAWSGFVPSSGVLAPPTSPATVNQIVTDTRGESAITFSTSTNEIDRFRFIFLIVGVLIGVYVLSD